ncbi:MAG: sensor histidine kinase, partial [Thermoflexus sp.]
MRAQEEERLRIARELHDGIGQSLSALVFGLNTISVALHQAPEEVPRLLNRLKVSVSDTIKELQDMIYDLRPTLLDDLGLAQALRWYARERLESRGVRVIYEIPDSIPRLPSEIETALFRIGQEAITNICKHAEATEVRIQLWVEKGWAAMEIADNGVGFCWPELQVENGPRRGWGLLGMQERAILLGGELRIDTAPHTTLPDATLHMPLPLVMALQGHGQRWPGVRDSARGMDCLTAAVRAEAEQQARALLPHDVLVV